MNLRFGIINLALAPLRADASDKSEMVSQLLFGEAVQILSQSPKWLKVKNAYDGYEGWISDKQVLFLNPEDYNLSIGQPEYICTDISCIASSGADNYMLTMGAVFPFYLNKSFRLGQNLFNTHAQVVSTSENKPTPEKIIHTAHNYLNAPYLWGGRSPFGIDCSGFTQMVFRFFGIKLYRDAYQQAEQGRLVEYIDQAQTGDLVFFDNENKKIIHVGIMMPEKKIIHASGKVRLDSIDHNGIFNKEAGNYSHKLRLIRRIL